MRADSAKISRILDALLAMRRQEVIDPDRREKRNLTLASFGLESPRARFVVGTELHADEILLGDGSPFGEQVYVRLNGGADVIGATCRLNEILPFDPEALMDRAVFPSSIRKAVRLEVKHPGGFFQLALRDGAWRIQQPVDERADGARVEWLLQTLVSLAITNFGESVSLGDSASFGLGSDESQLQVSLWPEGVREPLMLTVGKARQDTPDFLYARISNMERICAIHTNVLALQEIKAASLRDRRICDADPALITTVSLRDGDVKTVLARNQAGQWMIVEPLRFTANTHAVGSLLREICRIEGDEIKTTGGTNQIPPEAAEMTVSLVISNSPVTGAATNEVVPVQTPVAGAVWSYRLAVPGAESPDSLVFREEARSLYRVRAGDLARLWADFPGKARTVFSDPLPYMDCRILDLNPQQIRRITVSQQGREETVTVNADGIWSVESPPEGQISGEAIPALLELASHLQAERVESILLTNAVPYGLAGSAARVTFGLSGSGGIQKTILVGSHNGRDGVFSMVQGREVVFVLGKSVAEALLRPLVKMP